MNSSDLRARIERTLNFLLDSRDMADVDRAVLVGVHEMFLVYSQLVQPAPPVSGVRHEHSS